MDLDHSCMSGAVTHEPFTVPLPLRKHALEHRSVLSFELDRLRELVRQPLDENCLAHVEPVMDMLAELHWMTQTGHTEEDWQKLVQQCEYTFLTACLYGLAGESDACIRASWAALENAGIVRTPRSESV